MSYYYLYMIKFETGQFYIGSRKSKIPAKEDIDYWGSPGKINEPLWELEKEKHILFESTDISYKELTNKEKVFIGEAWKKYGKEKCINKHIGGNIDPKFLSKMAKERYADGIGSIANLTPKQRKIAHKNSAISKSIDFQVKDPNGKIYTAKGIYPFAKKHGLHGGNFWHLIRGNAKTCQGWTRA